jgi:hypothetical protein
VIVERALSDLVGGGDDQAGRLLVEQPELAVHLGRGPLEHPERPDDLHRHPVVADREVVERPLGLGPPVTIGGDLDRPHRVGLSPGVAGHPRD